jgi:diguanylate cyclase (GGDEF)-like protein
MASKSLPPVRKEGRTAIARSSGSIVIWQSTVRIALAVLAGTVLVGAAAFGEIRTLPPLGVASVLGYLLVIGVIVWLVERAREASTWHVAATVVADVLFVFGLTYQVVPPGYYDRALLLAIAILHFTEFYFGRRLATLALALSAALYVLMVGRAIGQGAGLSWAQEGLSLGVFVLASLSFIVHYGDFKRRLARLVTLFERAQEGDFSEVYDADAERRPDSITAVGRAYNQVRVQLANLVATDPLSGCLNRRGLEQQLDRELSRAVRAGEDLTLMALDVDQFKRINDTYGHLVGDAVIRQIGVILRNAARAGDVVARVGGDEFALLLPDTTAAGAYRLATRIREMVATQHFAGVPERDTITISVGLVADRLSDENAAHDLHSRADEALYAAKAGGRNRVNIWAQGRVRPE